MTERISQGEAAARDRMVRANLRLVVNIARGYTGKGLPLQDLIEEGNLGLLRAVEGFDPNMNTRFSTYASYWIKQSIKRALVNSAKTIRIPAYMVELLTKWRRASAKLADELNRTPTPEDIARELGIPRKKLRIVKKAITLYNASPNPEPEDGGLTLGDIVPDERIRGPEDELINTDNLTHVSRLLDEMDPREATILKMRFGLDDCEPQTLKEIGESLGLTRERHRDHDALLHAAGHLVRVVVDALARVGNADLLEPFRGLSQRITGTDIAMSPNRFHHLIADGEAWIQRCHRLLKNHRHAISQKV